MIVLSILVAFAIDAGWELRQERARLDAVLASLESGFEEHLRLVDDHLAARVADQGRIIAFMESEPEALASIQPDSAWLVLRAVYRSATAQVNADFLRTTLEEASLELLEDRALNEAIAVWRSRNAMLDEQYDLLLSAGQAIVHAVGRHPEARTHFYEPVLNGEPGAFSGRVLGEMRLDEELLAAATVKAHRFRIQTNIYRNVRIAADSVLVRIRSARGS